MLVEVLKFVSSDGIGVSQGNSLKKKKKLPFYYVLQHMLQLFSLKRAPKRQGKQGGECSILHFHTAGLRHPVKISYFIAVCGIRLVNFLHQRQVSWLGLPLAAAVQCGFISAFLGTVKSC